LRIFSLSLVPHLPLLSPTLFSLRHLHSFPTRRSSDLSLPAHYNLPDVHNDVLGLSLLLKNQLLLLHSATDLSRNRKMTLRFASAAVLANPGQMQYYSILQSDELSLARRSAPNLRRFCLRSQLT